ncbi:MAG: glutamine--tRNA ligase/YqeY domain fusion protein [Myxococcales bacterium]|nr:glutamine--tRNA ligase/YqeY domain fusion protein [Myxococcales bacterium]
MSKEAAPTDFIREKIAAELESGKYPGVRTRFPPEPSGYAHIGHAKPICLNFGVAEEFGGECHLRFDDTNPATLQLEYVEAIQEDIRWLGFDWGDRLFFASDHFGRLYESALELIRRGRAFVCELSSEEIAARRGSLTEPGEESPYRDRSPDENLELFERMRAGEFAPGERVLRAKIDMGSSVLPMRDPLIYRIVDTPHARTGTEWPIYPMYDFAHSLSDAFEGITHSLCGIEFTDRRPLYDWVLEAIEWPAPRPEQTEFGELNLGHTVLSKRKLRPLVEGGVVSGWDDPRLPTLRGLRRRGYPPEAIRNFTRDIGMTRRDVFIPLARLEASVREDLNRTAPRVMGVLDPLRVVIENYPEGQVEELEAVNNPEDPAAGTRTVPFSRTLWIERDDFLEDPPKKFHRMAPGREVRLRYAYFVTCTEVVKNTDGEVVELRCTYDPATRGGDAPDGRKVRGTIHWVSADRALEAEARLYDHLFTFEVTSELGEGEEPADRVNPGSLETRSPCYVEPHVGTSRPGDRVQLERTGYFCIDADSTPERPVLNRTVTLRDSWAKAQKKAPA